jgi:hypothetical protein
MSVRAQFNWKGNLYTLCGRGSLGRDPFLTAFVTFTRARNDMERRFQAARTVEEAAVEVRKVEPEPKRRVEAGGAAATRSMKCAQSAQKVRTLCAMPAPWLLIKRCHAM